MNAESFYDRTLKTADLLEEAGHHANAQDMRDAIMASSTGGELLARLRHALVRALSISTLSPALRTRLSEAQDAVDRTLKRPSGGG